MKSIELAASFIKNSEYILIGAGAGMGKDSGLPDYRGNQGFWNNYPPYRGKFNFIECANPNFLLKQPNLFWGFYGSRLEMYRKANPHKGFQMLLDLNRKSNKQVFALTSNVDGHFQRAGFAQQELYQIHGSIHFLQCDTCIQIKTNNFKPQINYDKMDCQTLPRCQKCKAIMRPNIWMFDDYEWISERSDKQQKNYQKFIDRASRQQKSLCLIEIGAGTAIPTIRNLLQRNYYRNKNSKFIRINLDKQDNKYSDAQRFVHLQLSALQALNQIQNQLVKV